MKYNILILLIIIAIIPHSFAQAEPIIDGIISENEYEHSFSVSSFHMSWTIIDTHIYFALVGETTGWIAIGIDAQFIMKDADMYFGYFDSSARAIDAYSDGQFGPHPMDNESEGTDDILAYAVVESDNTTFEFSRLLITNDSRDKPIEDKKVTIIWALGGSDDWTAKHVDRGSFTVNFFNPTEISVSNDTATPYIPIFAVISNLVILRLVQKKINKGV